ncbi:MAG: SRPBCC family protein [Pseudomonadota bacterium]
MVEHLIAELGEAAARPLDEALALSPTQYTDATLHHHELERIFATAWICLGRVDAIAEPGQYLTGEIGEQPVAVIRQKDGSIRAFSNVCLHRMMVLLTGEGTCKRLVCPYHAWTYDLDGQLIGAPEMKNRPGFDAREMRLPDVRCEVWHGWIYVTLDNAAQSVADSLAPLESVVARYRMADYVEVVRQTHVWDTNWKLLTENFMEGYHLPVAHRQTVGAWIPLEETGFPDGVHDACTWQTFTKQPDATYGVAHPDNTHLEGQWRVTSVMPTIFPTHMYVLAPDHLWYLSLMPKGVGQVTVRFGAAIAPERLAALDDPDRFLSETVDFFDQVNDEDRFVVEGIYKGARAPLAKAGPLSWLERELHDFHKYLARKLS